MDDERRGLEGRTSAKVDLNCDMGEGLSELQESRLIDLVTSVNIACGGHAGDERTMRQTLTLAKRREVRIGAHPSYPDPANFGRVKMKLSSPDLRKTILDQIRSLIEVARPLGAEVSYIKPHGALYNSASGVDDGFEELTSVARSLDLPLMLLAGSPAASTSAGTLHIIREGFTDRRYGTDGQLRERSLPDAVITDPDEACQQALYLAPLVDSLCTHSDTPGAEGILKAVRAALIAEGYSIG